MPRLLALAVVVCSVAPAMATPIYMNSSAGVVYSVDVDAKTYAPIYTPSASNGYFTVWGMASGPALGTLYLQNEAGAIDLYDIATGSLTSTGMVVAGNGFGEGPDGNWYVGGSYNAYTSYLTRINPTTSPQLDQYVGYGAYAYDGDIATDPVTNQVFCAAASGLAKLDVSTGVQTDWVDTGAFYGLGFTLDGRMFGGGTDGYIYQINPATGADAYVMDIPGITIFDMASEASYSAIPEPSSLGLGAAAAALTLGRRRRM